MTDTDLPSPAPPDDLLVFSADNFLDETDDQHREGTLVFASEGILFLANQTIDYRFPVFRVALLLATTMCSGALIVVTLVRFEALGPRAPHFLLGGIAALAVTAVAAWILLRSQRRRLRGIQPTAAAIEEVVTTWPGCWGVAPEQIASLRIELGGHADREVVVTVEPTDGVNRTLIAPHSFMLLPKKLVEEVRRAAAARGWPLDG